MIDLNDYRDIAFIGGQEAMYTFLAREVMMSNACRVCLAERTFNTIKEMNGSYIRGKRVVCLNVITTNTHTCHKQEED